MRVLDEDPNVALVLVEQTLRNENGLQVLAQIGRHHPGVARVLISADDSPELVQAAVRTGAKGVLPKSFSIAQMLTAIQHVLDGHTCWPAAAMPLVPLVQTLVSPPLQPGSAPRRLFRRSSRPGSPPPLTARQLQVLQILGEGGSNAQIAAALAISERTVKAHLKGVFEALGVHTRVQALVQAKSQGLIG
jgi:DNA-binding NarL/FixJ family response regulator